MLSELMQRIRDLLAPPSLESTFEEYVRDRNPQTAKDLEELERNWQSYKQNFFHKH